MNKQEAIKQAEKLEQELAKLKDIINKPEDVFDTTSYSEVCNKLGQREFTLSDFNFMPYKYRKKALAQAKIQQLEEFYNQGWVANWSDSNQPKYYPYFDTRSSGGLVFHDYYCNSYRFYGAVGFYKDSKTATFVGKTYINIYRDLI